MKGASQQRQDVTTDVPLMGKTSHPIRKLFIDLIFNHNECTITIYDRCHNNPGRLCSVTR